MISRTWVYHPNLQSLVWRGCISTRSRNSYIQGKIQNAILLLTKRLTDQESITSDGLLKPSFWTVSYLMKIKSEKSVNFLIFFLIGLRSQVKTKNRIVADLVTNCTFQSPLSRDICSRDYMPIMPSLYFVFLVSSKLLSHYWSTIPVSWEWIRGRRLRNLIPLHV